ncbi:PLDc N-terminal domain-containing protein [Halobiforma nitratireducens]|uniref:Cardiolipin synthase N-terminal domain-containing protein n=1 Tax=Halobiforma nitratireducens JCM 10879 TaxID=1227454 RepID=M0ML97_9EURY|nr:PLDc N-terminal domain-containing protein [Halobiforma nitratireducens]EMA46467.1 hypothetical protein C446_01318 [Halobiforma nitratireducens JCM 10879]
MPSLTVAAAAGGIGLLLFVAFTIAYLALVAWTYADAQQNSEHPAFLWTIVVFLAPILGLVLYLILGRGRAGPATRHRY